MIDLKNQNGVTILVIALSIIIMVMLATISLNFVVPESGILKRTEESRIQMNISGVQERVAAAFLVTNDIDNSVEELIDKGFVKKLLNSTNEEVYWITRAGLQNMASGYEDDIVDGNVIKLLNDGVIHENPPGRIRITSLDDLLNTRIYVIDRKFNVAYIDDKVYGQVEFIKSGTEPEVIWWKEK